MEVASWGKTTARVSRYCNVRKKTGNTTAFKVFIGLAKAVSKGWFDFPE
jgi:hypothetical protein